MARPKKPVDELKDQRVPIMMSEDELKAIDDWRFANRIASRGEAIRRLCQIGLKADENAESIWLEIKGGVDRRFDEAEKFLKLLGKGAFFLTRWKVIEYAAETNSAVREDFVKLLGAFERFRRPFLRIKGAETIEQALSSAKEASEIFEERVERLIREGKIKE